MACEICSIRYVRENGIEKTEVPTFGNFGRFVITDQRTLKCVRPNGFQPFDFEELDSYRIKYCPNCGRDLTKSE